MNVKDGQIISRTIIQNMSVKTTAMKLDNGSEIWHRQQQVEQKLLQHTELMV